MCIKHKYLMESDEEAIRLDIKTDCESIKKQALWAGIKPGMRVADIGCGPGKTTYYLYDLVKPDGEVVGFDNSDIRLDYAKNNYNSNRIEYINIDICKPIIDIEPFDFIWVRFVLEYFRKNSYNIVKYLTKILKPGGILCLIDLDSNCLRHFGLPVSLEKSIQGIMKLLEDDWDFDPYVGIKLYSYLYDLNYKDIDVCMTPHNLIFGTLKDEESYNWQKKMEIAGKNSGYMFPDYKNGFNGFREEFRKYFVNSRRFTYTPLILCRGIKGDS